MHTELLNYDAMGLANLIKRREITAAELAEIVITRIEAINPDLNFMAFKAYDHGRVAAASHATGGVLAGVPLLMKDIALSCSGIPCRSGSVFFKSHVPQHDSVIVQRLKAQGMVILGTTTTPELGLSLESSNALVGVCRNPWDITRTPGGSSGGAAAAVAARVLPLAHATDGGGSIRVPASYCGLVGLKTSRGRVSFAPDGVDLWYGGITEGCVSVSVRDTAAYADVIWGALPGEPYEYPPLPRPLLDEVSVAPGRLRVGVVKEVAGGIAIEPTVREALLSTAALLEDLGHDVELVDIAFAGEDFQAVYTRIIGVLTEAALTSAEAALERRAVPGDLSRTTWGFRALGREIGGVEHAIDIETMRRFGRDLCIACHPYDIVLTPTLANLPTQVGDPNQDATDFQAHVNRLFELMHFTAPVNVSGLPSISLPLYWSEQRLPIGVQAIGRRGAEAILIRLAAELEQVRPWAGRRPSLCI